MINDLKLGIRMLRYAYGRTASIVSTAIFGIDGLVICLLGGDCFLGGFFLVVASMWVLQMLYSLSVSNMVLASPQRKKMQISVPVALNCTCMTVMYTVLLFIQVVWVMRHPERVTIICNGLVWLALVMAVLMVFTAFAYKYFVVSMLAFYVVFFTCNIGKEKVLESNLWNSCYGVGNFIIAALIGYVAIAVGGYLQYKASLLIYRKPMSKAGQPATLRKYL